MNYVWFKFEQEVLVFGIIHGLIKVRSRELFDCVVRLDYST
jgi:hypothetical protein